MDPITIGFAASTALNVGAKIFGGISANKKAEKAAKEQARFTGAQRAEEIRQRRMSNEMRLGEAKARAYASNLQPTGSTNRYITALDMENMREISAARYARKKEMEAIREGGQGAGTGLFYEAAGDLLGSVASGFAASMAQPSVASNGGIPGHAATISPSESFSYTDTPGGMGA